MNRFVLALLLLMFCAAPVPVAALDFNAYWLYRSSGGEGRATSNEFQERYTLGVGPQLSWQPTHALTATAAVGYTRTQRDSGDGMRTVDEITPSANLGIINDLFSAQLAGSARRSSGSDVDTSASHSWDATLASRWQQAWWPNLRFNYGERDSGEPSSELFSRTEQIQKYASANLDWDLRLLQLDYRYNTNWDDNASLGSETERRQHFVRAVHNSKFWDDRVSYNISHQYEHDQTLLSGDPSSEGFLVELTVVSGVKAGSKSEYLVYFDDVAKTVDPSFLDPAGELPLEILNDEYLYVMVSPSSGQRIDLLLLNFNNNDRASSLEWDLYRRDQFDTPWLRFREGVQGSVIGNDLNIVNDQTGDLLLVAQNPTDDLNLNRIRAITRIDEGSRIIDERHLTSAGLQVRLTRSLDAGLNATLERQRRQAQGDDDRSSLSARLRWTPRPWITPSVSFSVSRFESEDQDGDDQEQLSRSYSLNVATVPLPTLNLGFGVTRTERTSERMELNSTTGQKEPVERKGESMLYSVSATARLYPDLNTALFLNWLDNRNRVSTAGTSPTSDKSFTSRFNLNARLSRTLSADLTTSYRNSDNDNNRTEVADATMSLQYRPSSMLALRGFYIVYLLDSEQKDVVGGSMDLALLRTSKTRINFNYNVTHAETLTNRFGLNGSWDISRALALQSRGNYTLAETDFYDVQVSLNLRL